MQEAARRATPREGLDTLTKSMLADCMEALKTRKALGVIDTNDLCALSNAARDLKNAAEEGMDNLREQMSDKGHADPAAFESLAQDFATAQRAVMIERLAKQIIDTFQECFRWH